MKTIVAKIAAFVFLALVTGALFAASADTTVYITKTGEKYHVSSCSSLRKSKIPISLGDAVARGYGCCQRCGPPALD